MWLGDLPLERQLEGLPDLLIGPDVPLVKPAEPLPFNRLAGANRQVTPRSARQLESAHMLRTAVGAVHGPVSAALLHTSVSETSASGVGVGGLLALPVFISLPDTSMAFAVEARCAPA